MEEQVQQTAHASGGGGGGGVISLRPLQLSDVDDFMVWAADPDVARFCRWEPYTSRDDALAFIAGTVLPHPYYQAICLDGRPVGAVWVTRNEAASDACRGELGYALGSGYWGRGIVTEAVRMAVAEVFGGERPELERVEALVDVENKASQRVLEKAGFTREGVLRKYVVVKGRTRDLVVFSRLSTDDDDDDDS
ncbi:uncharacterized N-acetyltransferase p20-like isoform X2 [Rhodamnia argentea]|uniref:Uncharacterized N-acetyltransferase p20-like isoform X2 n=1 Tax=Rhodamnia argentea TaxID=178133 RepID=A0ABM3HFT8_9MYRT|nr:uncharacterized N-acetyltransferase p20-like isoform X2 [Rhodamnia argentea]